MLTAGNLSVTQTRLVRLSEAIDLADATPETSIMLTENMLEVATLVGDVLSRVPAETKARMDRMNQMATATMIVAGQRKGGRMRLFLIYPVGNFIKATEETPYLQIGEHKYGKSILDRLITNDTPLEEARKAVLLSMDSTLRSNLSVGMPLEMAVIKTDALRITEQRRIEANDENFAAMSAAWSQALRDAFSQIS